ncbi:N-acetyltransferase [Streptomyces ruber]|uniref:N-acetyltransferase n=2 Tax=Streptomyces TaxID=1883 RepID=A0A918BF49_9ACTN|nr:GNAT family N-acetyltransferase [Streptomyces ruber]GGQ62584.1 N-acetyltransferase [Streptomyces ruber]
MNRALPGVRLRVPTDEDAVTWHRIFDHPEVMEYHGGRSAELSVYEELTARQRRHDAERGFCLWSVLDEEGRVIGFTGAQPWPHEWGAAPGDIEIGWRLARPYWGQGYVTAAAHETLDRLRRAGVPSVVALVAAGNERSIAVTRRLGMELEEVFTTPSSERTGHRYRLAL